MQAMTSIIDGKRYDTETATKVADWDSGNTGDLSYTAEALYRAKNGGWFLDGEGGPQSRYAKSDGDSMGYGSSLVPLTPEKAYAWVQQHGETEAVLAYFADRVKDA